MRLQPLQRRTSLIRAVVGSVLLAACIYFGLALWVGWGDMSSAVARIGVPVLALVLGLALSNFGLRFVRWNAYLRAMGHQVAWWPSLKIYVAGFALTTTSVEAGEALRSVLLKHWGMPHTRILAALFAERLSDLLAIVLLALVGLLAYPAARPPTLIGACAAVAGFLILSNQAVPMRLHASTSKASLISRVLHHGFKVLLEARRCHSPWLLAVATALSLAAWSAEAIAATLLFRLATLWFAVALGMVALALAMKQDVPASAQS